MILALAVHLKGFGLALRWASQISMAASRSAALLNTPRRIVWRVISANSRSTRLIRREVQLEARVLSEPGLHLRGLVGLVVVADRVHGEVVCDGPVDLFQEADELLGAVTRQALADDLASLDIEGRKQRRRAIAFVVVRHRLSTALLHRQARLRAIERLNLAFLVDAEHNRLVGRVEVEPDDVDHFFSEFWIVGELEWARQMWRLIAQHGFQDVQSKACAPWHEANIPCPLLTK